MAVSPRSRRQQPCSNSPRSQRNRSRRSSPTTPPPPLPKGPCNWRNLQTGTHANTCGCRRFWSRAGSVEQEQQLHGSRRSSANNEKVFCYCGHHACFHLDQAQQSEQDASQAMPPPSSVGRVGNSHSQDHASQQSGRKAAPSWNRDRLFSDSISRDSLFGEPKHPRRQTSAPIQAQAAMPSSHVSGLGLYIESTRNQPLSAKLSAAAQYAANQLPATRTPSRMTPTEIDSERSAPYNASPSRAFPEQVAQQRTTRLGLGIPQIPAHVGIHPDDMVQSATEVATPSIEGTPALRAADDAMDQIKLGVDALHRDVIKLHHSPAGSTQVFSDSSQRSKVNSPLGQTDRPGNSNKLPTLAALISHVSSLRHLMAETPNLGKSLADLGQRVNALESASFAGSIIGEHDTRLENFDGRILGLESRVDELDKFRSDLIDTSGSSRTASPSVSRDIASRDGLGNGPTPLVDMASNHHKISPRLSAVERLRNVEQRLSDIFSAGGFAPAPLVEVILLPWGRNLNGIWQDPKDASQASGAIDKTETLTQSAFGRSSRADSSEGLFGEWRHAELAARAVGPTSGVTGRIYERLKSRGFVRQVSLGDGGARTIYSAICGTFGNVLRDLYHERNEQEADGYPHLQALKSPFVPLRKVHKHSRLRFLSEPELNTPALWTLQFLESGVFMKAPSAGITKLFITTPSAYLQHASNKGLTWQKIRELPRVQENQLSQAKDDLPAAVDNGVPEADAQEPCWEYDPKLDPPASQQSSFASNVSFESSHHPSPPETKAGADEEDEDPNDPDYEEDGEFEGVSSDDSEPERMSHAPAPITPMSDWPSARPSLLQRRTSSFPLTQAGFSTSMPHITLADQPHPKRQVASFDHAFAPGSNLDPLLPASRPLSSLSKRRRLSRTPSGRAPTDDEAPWALTPRRSHGPSSAAHEEEEEVEEEQDIEAAYHQQRAAMHAGVKVPLKDRGVTAYATPYSFTGPRAPDTKMDEASDADLNSSDDEDVEGDGDTDPDFADEGPRSTDSEMEIDEAVTQHEEEWEGMGDDESEDEKGRRIRVGHSRRKVGPRRKVRDNAMSDDEEQDDVGDQAYVEGSGDESMDDGSDQEDMGSDDDDD